LNIEWTFLVNVSNDIEADMVISLLESYDIKAKKHYPSGSNLSKTIVGTVKNVDVYVDGKMLENAKDVINNYEG